ncbi:STAS domain-containing protein [Micromonospora profundi]|uniref:STAS domain-containing protein n=1 Tax=Micromonospora profundi TaxID=1420889 RepID=A0AAJ6HV74_9ACTN|nr:STAS domain-containing protein [Micromonospora profundi]WLS44574.1 STAS domain-containing protein [Micromonospora profundi]
MTDQVPLPRPEANGRHSAHLIDPIMVLTLSRDGSTSLIRVVGEIDMSNAHLITELVELLCATPTPLVTLDLSEVRFFGAHGVSALLRTNALIAAAGGRLVLREPSPFVRRILSVCRVARHLTLDLSPASVGPAVNGVAARLTHRAPAARAHASSTEATT